MKPHDDTRARLLKAAAEVFAEQGFEHATIRQICSRASANVALVNYHFGDKLELYTEVLRYCKKPAEGDAAARPWNSAADPQEALREIIRAMLERAFEGGDQANLRYRLMLHEFVKPTAATKRIVDVVMRPVYDRLRAICAAISGLSPDHETTRLTVHSIMGQVAHYAHSTPILMALWPDMKVTPPQREMVARHIAELTLAYLDRQRVHQTVSR
ncbi:MAG: hypothetical protein C5B51_12265 [Terriglobia bacterium]|nr:MAG: hypothetical protein C5B51_12265 [Terriglobia bacterium]